LDEGGGLAMYLLHKTTILPKEQMKMTCEIIPTIDGEWVCETHNMLIIAKNEPVGCVVGYTELTQENEEE